MGMYLFMGRELKMSSFSHLLANYINEKKIKKYALAQYCGIDRSSMYKIIDGKRNPPSFDIVQRIAFFLQLTPFQQEEFFETYQILLAGRENYYRRKKVLDFLTNFKKNCNPYPISPTFDISSALENLPETHVLNSRTEVYQAIIDAFSLESMRESGHLRLMIQPSYDFLSDSLVYLGNRAPNLQIDHIVCLDNHNALSSFREDSNLDCLRRILPLYTAVCTYRPYYYYGDMNLRQGAFQLLPYLLITSDDVITFSKNLEKGIVFRNTDVKNLYLELYQEYLNNSRPLLVQADDITHFITATKNVHCDASNEYSFQMEPCITAFLTEDILKKRLSSESSSRNKLIEVILEHSQYAHKMLKEKNVCYIFSADGIKYFLETGLISEYPSDLYSPLLPDERIYLMKQFLSCSDYVTFRMLKSNIGEVFGGITIYITPISGYIQFLTANKKLVYLNIKESGLLGTFWDFFDNMDETLYYSHETSVELSRQIVRQFESRFSSSC